MRKTLFNFATVVCVCLFLNFNVVAYDSSVRKKVIVPDYPFVINGTHIDFSDSQYPVICYNDITYFPMTWHYCRMLGVVTEWNSKTGLHINKANATAEPSFYDRLYY